MIEISEKLDKSTFESNVSDADTFGTKPFSFLLLHLYSLHFIILHICLNVERLCVCV